jgi:O-antigen/teichoic acid export membrane protein
MGCNDRHAAESDSRRKLRFLSGVSNFVSGFFAQAWRHRSAITRVSLLGYATMAMGFVLQIMIARTLGVQLYGVYATNLAIVAIVEIPIVVRSGELAMRNMRPYPGNAAPSYWSLSRLLVRRDVWPFVGTYILVAGAGWIFGSDLNLDPLLLSILALTIPAQIGFGAYKCLFFVHNQMPRLGRTELTYALALLALSLVGLLAAGVYGLAAASAVAALVKTLLTRNGSRRFAQTDSEPALPPKLDVSRDSLYSIARNALSNGLTQFDVILLSQTQAPEAIALYKVGKSLTSLPIKLSFPLWRMLQPQIMAAVRTDDRGLERRAVLTGSIGFGLLMVVALPLVLLFGEDFIVLAYGEPFRGAFVYFLILMVGVWLFNGVAGWFSFWCVVAKSQAYGLMVYAAAFLLALLGGLLWGMTSPTRMAYVVSGALVVAAALAYLLMYTHLRSRSEDL